MNFFLCNRCNKNSDENIFNFNHEEIILKDSNHYYTNIDNNYNFKLKKNCLCVIEIKNQFPPYLNEEMRKNLYKKKQ